MGGGTDRPGVSVVVPTHNSGPHLGPLVSSLSRQGLPPGGYEVIFADDGSTDDTPQRLDELAAADPHVRVLHLEHSGWPSRPRNLGVEAARGEYVFFADDDDWFGDEALARLLACAREHDADIVIGRIVGHGRGVPRELFRENRFDADLTNAPLADSMTCHKLFRRAFLERHGLRFPEGRPRRLEDHRLVAEAYVLAGRVCVLADHPCYHHVRRADAGNVTATRMDPAEYYAALRAAMDVVDAHEPPAVARLRLHRRWLRQEVLNRLRGCALLAAPEPWLEQVVHEVGPLIRDRFAPEAVAGVPPLYRVTAHLAEQGRVADLRRLAEWEVGVRAHATVDDATVVGRTLTIDLSAHLTAGEEPLRFDDRGLPVLPVAGAEPPSGAAMRASGARTDVVVRRRETRDEFFLPSVTTTERIPTGTGADAQVRHRTTATVDFAALNGGRTRGAWEVRARVTQAGWALDTRLPLVVHCATDGGVPRVEDPRRSRSRLRRAVRRIRRALRRTARVGSRSPDRPVGSRR
ncbi:glycosyltransferase family 2 protein [Micromonospora sp. WMMD998]|uniref:glycosyltransferase family 2 protein n=1 Tax=Micromonospora sp. WMMD998 TaxID=3016092 RepID=UPI002499F6AD|nr:glycosyltransferase family 2 protein [Micromonospora sp. WMMD998]WFE42292.1 glycosyltransferase family 2 protein [Micromonospora sp. WMMD998]